MRVSTLTPEQAQAVELGDGAYLITAPPGSGKTEVLVQRIIRLLDDSRGETFRILALTYTVRAAGELKDRIRQTVSDQDEWRVEASTFHAFAFDLLKNYGEAVGLKGPLNVISDSEDKRILLSAYLYDSPYLSGAFELDSVDSSEWRKLFSEIALRKTNLHPPEPSDGNLALNGLVSFHFAYEAYEMALADSGSVDYEGMIHQAGRLLKADPWVGSHLRRQYRHILVDEGQELTCGQYDLLKDLWCSGIRNMLMLADAHQSINSFVGGGPRFIREFVQDFKAREFDFAVNFRSAQRIVSVLRFLSNGFSTGKGQSHPTGAPREGQLASGWVGACSYPSEEVEAVAVTEWVISLLANGLDRSWVYEGESPEVAYEDICLLGRTRYVLRAVVSKLKVKRVPVVLRTEHGALFESCLGRSGYYTLQLSQNPNNLSAMNRLLTEINGNRSDLPPSDEYFDAVRTVLRKSADNRTLPWEYVDALTAVFDAPTNGLEVVYDLIALDPDLGQAGPDAWYRDQQLLRDLLDQYTLRTSGPNRSLSGFLSMIARTEQAAVTEPGVRALTPHRARGLGFKVVVVLGMNEGTLPDYRATSSSLLDEERRVVYVAASRAARALLFTRPRKRRSSYGNSKTCQESSFINEMGLTMRNLP